MQTWLPAKALRCCGAIGLLLLASAAKAEPQSGWWWNPSESGRGFFIEMRNGLVYLAGYFYDADGRATWLTSGGPQPDPYAYQGTLQSYRNGQTVFGPYRPPEPAVDVGPVSVGFIDDGHGTITWPGGVISIERQIFDVEDPIPEAIFALTDPPFRPQTGWWWNETESGTGYSVEVRGSSLFVVAFMYDDAGNPIWYYTAGPMASPTHYEGDWLLFSGGQTMNGPYHPPALSQSLGRVIIDFTSQDEATIEFTDLSMAKRSTRRNTRGNLLGANDVWPLSAYWPKWIGQVTLTTEDRTSTTHEKESWQFLVTYEIQQPHMPGRVSYLLKDDAHLSYHFEFTDSETGCRQESNLGVGGGGVLQGELTVRDDLSYVGDVSLPSVTTASVTEVCVDPSDGTVRTSQLADRIVSGGLEFGGSQLFGPVHKIVNFYPAFAYDPNRPHPTMQGTELRELTTTDWLLTAP